ncbi:NB-ARC domain-containing protein [Glycomyces salinus]|uniref:NB-ARC domain-containing protein n=1 Tax=Glycomyces salinus TaxID=980294 RepID=UPI0018EE14FE|nr:NB-ARC domain-containing protein [Glycomyces salinus]
MHELAEGEVAALLDCELPVNRTLLLIPRDGSAAQLELLAGLRTLAHRASITPDSDRFVAEIMRTDLHTRARSLLTLMHGNAATTEHRRRVHALMRRLRVPRPAEVRDLLLISIDDPAAAVRAERRFEEVEINWPAPADLAAETPAATANRERVVLVPGQGNPAEERTRRELLDQISHLLADKEAPARVALVAEGGMGKSSLAVRICRDLERGYDVVGWLSATNSETWRSSVALLAERLGLEDAEPEKLWSALGRHRTALIVVDDAPEPDTFAALPPWTPGLHVLITSKSIRWRAEATVKELAFLDEDDGVEYLLARTGAESERLAAAITRRLGGFPLALEQAAAVVVDGLSLRGWLDRYGDEPVSGSGSLKQAWEVRLAELRTRHPDALDLLRILSCAQSTPVPGGLLATLGADFDDPAAAVCADTERRDAAVAQLRAQALIRTGADEETLLVHPLLAEAVRDDPDLGVARIALLVAAAAGHLLDSDDINESDRWSRTMTLSAVAIAACGLVFHTSRLRPRSVSRDELRGLATYALWHPTSYLHERGASRVTYRTSMLALAMHGDESAAAAMLDRFAEVVDTFGDLDRAEVVPAEQLGHVPPGEARMSAARWLNEIASLLMDVDLASAEAYARRALAILPRRLAGAGELDGVPWPDAIRIEIQNNLGFIRLLREDFRESKALYDSALRRLLSFPEGANNTKYAELLSNRALVLLERGLPERGRRDFAAASEAARVSSQGPDVLYNVENNLALTEHQTWRLRSAHRRLATGLQWLRGREAPQSTSVLIEQCNLGRVLYDIGATDEGFDLTHSSWRILADRLGAEDRETIIRRMALAELQLARGDRRAAQKAVLLDLKAADAAGTGEPVWAAVHRLRSAWLSGVAAVPPDTARDLAQAVERAFGPTTSHAAMARGFLAAWALADPTAVTEFDIGSAVATVGVAARSIGREHPLTLLATARLALLRSDLGRHARPLRAGGGRRLLATMDSLTSPGADGFAEDLARHGQHPVDPTRPGWEAERLLHLIIDGVADLDSSEELCWRANAGRLAALARAPEAGALLRDVADASAALYGPLHPWTLLREAAAAIAADDPEALRAVATAPVWN